MRIRLQAPGHAASLLTELNRCRQSRRYCDVVLQVGNRTFAAHRAVLACGGTYFRNLFTRAPSSSTAAFSLEFISPATFEKVLTFVYTGEILTDLIDVRVLYELSERLGVNELVRACHATFPDLQASGSADCKAGRTRDLTVESCVATVSASSVCSSAASYSSLSSSTAATPATASSPLLRGKIAGAGCGAQAQALYLKTEDAQFHLGYGHIAADHRPLLSNHSGQCNSLLPAGLVHELKTEQGLKEEEEGGNSDAVDTHRGAVSKSTGCSLPPCSNTALFDTCPFPDSSAQFRADTCDPTSSSGEPVGGLQIRSAQGSTLEIQTNGGLVFAGVQEEREGTEEEQWRQLAGEIIELSDDEKYIEEAEEEEEDDDDDEHDLVCVENRERANLNSQGPGDMLLCKVCSAPFRAEPGAVKRHAESHLTDLGLCTVCGASTSSGTAGLTHTLSHIGVQLFTCDMCHLQFCSQKKLLQHHRQTASSYTLSHGALTDSSQGLNSELQCAVCRKTLSKDLQTVKDHLLNHVCVQSLSCAVCQLPQSSLCTLLWHALNHLALPIFSCPHCTCSFVERLLLDKHMSGHAEEAVAEERELRTLRSELCGSRVGSAAGVEELHCFLCPQTFDSSTAFQQHLNLHARQSLVSGGGTDGCAWGQGWLGKRKAEQALEYPASSSPGKLSGLTKMSSLAQGKGMDFSIPDKFLQGSVNILSTEPLTNGSSVQDGGAGAAAVRGKWYHCRHCGKRFAHSGEFTYHLRIHTGEKPYQCKVCLRFFRGRSTMICHLKTHAGALMYRCTVCGLYFSTLKLVSSHMEVHREQLPPDFTIEQTFMYNDHSKEPLPTVDA